MSHFELGSLYTGQLVRLGAVKPDEKEALSRWSHDADYMRNLHFDQMTPRVPVHFEEKEKDDKDSHSSPQFGIRTLTDDKLIGMTGLWGSWNHQSGWFWIGIGEAEYRGKGYGTDATHLLVNYAFREMNLHRIQLGVFGYNQRAKRAYEKVGFLVEGVIRESLYRDGQRHDQYIMSILRPEWEARLK
jgi:RimJ/RimL family protein N-acetyltransferase